MNPALIVMAILGCADGGDQCQTVQIAPTRFESVAQCNAAAEATLNRYAGLTYPVVAVRCQKAAGPTLVDASTTPGRLVEQARDRTFLGRAPHRFSE